MRREKTAGAAKRRMAFQYAAGGMPDDRGPSPVRFGGGGICAREPPLVGQKFAVGPAGRSGQKEKCGRWYGLRDGGEAQWHNVVPANEKHTRRKQGGWGSRIRP